MMGSPHQSEVKNAGHSDGCAWLRGCRCDCGLEELWRIWILPTKERAEQDERVTSGSGHKGGKRKVKAK